MSSANHVTDNFRQVQAAIRAACLRAGRNPDEVTLLAVTKYAPDSDVLALLDAGLIRHIGESRVRQAADRWTQPAFAKHNITKHFIGHLQRNKAALAVRIFDCIDSVDDADLARLLNAQAEKLDKTLRVLIQIKLTDRESQSGVSLENAPRLLEQLRGLKRLIPCGYMAIAPQGADKERLRALFKQVKEAFDRDFPADRTPQRVLSLGMSADFETAVEEGSTLPRIGSRLFAAHSEEL